MNTLYLCGAGNSEGVRLALRINQTEDRWGKILLLDDDRSKLGLDLLGVEIVGPFSCLEAANPLRDEVVNLVARTTRGRKAAGKRIESRGIPWATLVSPDVDTCGAELGQGVTIYQNATVGPETRVGNQTVVFMGAVVGHESVVAPGCVIGSNAVLNARVQFGEGVYAGTNSTVLPEVTVGSGATIGAGSVVVSNVPGGATALGVPAEVLLPDPSPRPRAPDAGGPPQREGPADTEFLEGVMNIWRRVLGLPRVRTDVNFFDLGGRSLHALQVQVALSDQMGIKVSLTDLFRFTTVDALARHVAALSGRRSSAPPADTLGSPEGRGVASGGARPLSAGNTPEGADSLALERLEASIAGVWGDVLGISNVGPSDDFFRLGGTEEQAREACERLGTLTGRGVAPLTLSIFPCPNALARFLSPSSDDAGSEWLNWRRALRSHLRRERIRTIRVETRAGQAHV